MEFTYNGIKKIEKIQFDIFGNREITNFSVIKNQGGIEISELYEQSEPRPGGLLDPRLGVTDSTSPCATCGFDTTFCHGHFGHMKLAEPMFHIGYLEYVAKVFACVCTNCSNLLLKKNKRDLDEILKKSDGMTRLNEIKDASKNISFCDTCKKPVPKVKLDKKGGSGNGNSFISLESTYETNEGGETLKKINKFQIMPEVAINILQNISDDDCEILGFKTNLSRSDRINATRPEMMIYKMFPIPPIAIRPSAKGTFLGGAVTEDDLTRKMADMVKANNRIYQHRDNTNDVHNKYNTTNDNDVFLLQQHCIAYLDDDAAKGNKQDSKQFKSLMPRLKSKEGRIRSNLMGKRGDFSARTVITPDANIDFDQLGVPKKIAMTITFPEIVGPHNIEFLKKLVNNGRDIYPGANYVFEYISERGESNRRVTDLRFKKEEINLKNGDVVERHLRDGDTVLFNRQPTLHKQSMMAHKVTVIDNDDLLSFRMSPCVCTPYGADYDGEFCHQQGA